MTGLDGSLSQSDDLHEDRERQVASNVSQENIQLQIIRLIQDMQRRLKPKIDRPKDRRTKKNK